MNNASRNARRYLAIYYCSEVRKALRDAPAKRPRRKIKRKAPHECRQHRLGDARTATRCVRGEDLNHTKLTYDRLKYFYREIPNQL